MQKQEQDSMFKTLQKKSSAPHVSCAPRGMRAPLFTNVDEYNQSIEKRKKKQIKNRKENKNNNIQIHNL
jgi:hypothetical protein